MAEILSMSAQILQFNGQTRLDIDPANVIGGALEAKLTKVIVIGQCEDGARYIADSIGDVNETIARLEHAKMHLLGVAFVCPECGEVG